MISEIFNVDCMEYMKDIPDKHFELAVVDPPYGIFTVDKETHGGGWAKKYSGHCKKWDTEPPAKYFQELKRISQNQIIFGANYFGFEFRNFIIWRKKTISESFTMAMAEIASVSINGNGKVFEYQPQDSNRIHPTQKPVALYK